MRFSAVLHDEDNIVKDKGRGQDVGVEEKAERPETKPQSDEETAVLF